MATPEELLAMMELEDAAADEADLVTAERAARASAADAPNPQALKVDQWTVRRGAEMWAESDDLRRAAGKVAEKKGDAEYWGRVAADFHAAAYEPGVEAHKVCEDALRGEYVAQLLDTPDFHEIRSSTVLNPVAAEVATEAFMAQFGKRLALAEKAKAEAASKPAGKPGKPGRKGKAPAAGGGDDAAAKMESEIATMRAAAAACAAAREAVDDATDAMESCGMGGPGGDSGGRVDAKKLAALMKRIKNSPTLKKMMEFAGRFRRVAASKQRMKVTHGADEVVGTTLGSELARLVPSELMRLVCPELDTDTLRRMMEGQTLSREMKATEPAGRGPIVVTVDESGSMQGSKVETAKGLALAMAWIARRQKRWCILVGYSGGTSGNPLVLPPGGFDEAKLLDWLEHFYGNGTDRDVPTEELPKWWPAWVAGGLPRGKTDVVMITDAACRLDDAQVAGFLKFKADEQVRLSVLAIANQPGVLERLADEVFKVPAIAPNSEATEKILSV